MIKNNHKKFIIIIFAILAFFAVIKAPKIKKYFENQRYYKYLLTLNLLKHCYVAHPDIEAILAQEGFDYYANDLKVTSDSLYKLENKNIQASDIPKIPMITHHVYFSANGSLPKLDDFYIEELKLHFNNLNALSDGWQHNIWTNQANLFPAEVTKIKGVKVRSITEFDDHPVYQNLIDVLKKGNELRPYLTEATDFVRLMAVQKFGGIYSDMDYEIYNPKILFDWMKKFDFIGARETMYIDSFYTNAFFAAKPNHPILNDALERRFRNYNLEQKPDYIKYPCNIYDRILFNGPVLMAISYFAKNNIDGNSDIIFPSWMMMNMDFSRFKNNHCKLSEITKESFNETNKNLDKILAEFADNPEVDPWQYKDNINNPALQNIYYNLKYHNGYDIIGTDASCGTWIIKGNHSKFYYWNWPWKK